MTRDPISLRSLNAFHSVVTLGSVAAAAEQLFITQPAISHLLKSLDKSTGLTLFQKAGRRITLSEDGIIFFEEVANGIQVLGDLQNAADAIRSAKTGHVRIVSIPVTADVILPKILAEFQQANPGVQITLDVAEQYRALSILESGIVDLALVAAPASNDFEIQSVIHSEAMLLVPQSWVVTPGRHISLKSLEMRPFIALSSGSPFRLLLNQYLVAQKLNFTTSVHARTQSAITELVRSGAGFAIIDKIVERKNLDGIATFPLKPALNWRFQLLSRKKHVLSTATAKMVAWMKEETGEFTSERAVSI